MSDPISRTAHGDAPFPAARNPDASAATEAAQSDDALLGRTVSINRARSELYAFWRDFRDLPRFMHNVRSLSAEDSGRTRWVIAAPTGQTVEWRSVITEDVPNRISSDAAE